MDSGPSAKYYMPPYLIGPADEARQAFEKLNGAPIPMEFVSIGPGDEVSLGEGCRVRAFPTAHRVSSQGYAILQTKRRGLMPQFRDLSPEELRDLAKQGVVLNEMETTVEVVYTGDTVMAPLIQEPLIWQAKLLIIEVTYLEGSCDSAVKYQHIHVNDLKTVAHMVHSEMVVICHTSSRYSPKAVRSLLQEALPETLLSRVWLAQRGLYQVLSSPIQPWKAAR
jgi:ribonuclease Z